MPSHRNGVTRLIWGRIRGPQTPPCTDGGLGQADVKDGLSEIMLIKISVNYHRKDRDPGLNTTRQES